MTPLAPGDPGWRESLQRVMVDVSAQLLGPQGFDDAVDASLAELGAFAGAHRAYLFVFTRDARAMSNTHEWCAPGVEPQIDQLQNLPADVVPWWTARVRAGRSIHLRTLDDLPSSAQSEREILAAQDIKSLLVVPVEDDDAIRGFIGFDDVGAVRRWREPDLDLLRVAGQLIGSALARRRATDIRRRAEARAVGDQRRRAVERFAAGAAHDLNDLLAVITTYVEVAYDEVTRGSQVAEDLREALDASARARDLVRAVFAFGRDGGAPRRLRLNDFLCDAADRLRDVLGRSIELDLQLCAGLPAVEIDPDRLERTLVDLAVNARAAMPAGGRFEVETLLHHGDEPRVRLRVSDDGVGMAPDVAEHAFDPFFTTRETQRARGLGLARVHDAIEAAGGTVTLRTEPGEGATFFIDLPPLEEALPRPDRPLRVLLVEDEPALRKISRRMLESAGYQVDEAADAAEAEALLLAEVPDLLITDIELPDRDGAELVREARARHTALSVLYVSGLLGAALDGVHLDDDALFLRKPFSRRQLLNAVETALMV